MASRACLACTLLNAPSQTVCSLCGTPLPLQNCEDKDASDEKVEADRSSGGSDGYYSKNRKILGRNPQAFQISFEVEIKGPSNSSTRQPHTHKAISKTETRNRESVPSEAATSVYISEDTGSSGNTKSITRQYYKVLKRDPAATGIMPIMGLVKLPHLGVYDFHGYNPFGHVSLVHMRISAPSSALLEPLHKALPEAVQKILQKWCMKPSSGGGDIVVQDLDVAALLHVRGKRAECGRLTCGSNRCINLLYHPWVLPASMSLFQADKSAVKFTVYKFHEVVSSTVFGSYIIRTMIRTIAKMETGIFGHEGVECVHEAGGGMKEEESGCAFGKLAPRFVQISFRDNCPGGHSFFSVARLKNRAVLSYHLVLDPASHSSHGTILSKLKSASSVEDIIVAERYCDSNNTVGKSSRSNSAEMNLSSEPMKERIVQNNESKLVTPAQIMSSFCLMSKSIMETVNSLRRYERDEYKNSFGTQRPA